MLIACLKWVNPRLGSGLMGNLEGVFVLDLLIWTYMAYLVLWLISVKQTIHEGVWLVESTWSTNTPMGVSYVLLAYLLTIQPGIPEKVLFALFATHHSPPRVHIGLLIFVQYSPNRGCLVLHIFSPLGAFISDFSAPKGCVSLLNFLHQRVVFLFWIFCTKRTCLLLSFLHKKHMFAADFLHE